MQGGGQQVGEVVVPVVVGGPGAANVIVNAPNIKANASINLIFLIAKAVKIQKNKTRRITGTKCQVFVKKLK